jgi:N-acetylneuraminate lyase
MKRGREKAPPAAIGGVNVASITPRRAGEVEVDLGAMLELIDFAGASGVDGIVLFGAAGEFIHFSPADRSRFVALAGKRSRVPVVANVSHSALDAALMMAAEAARGNIAAVTIMPPYFYQYSDDTVEQFCLEFGAQAARWIPVLLWDTPQYGNPLPPGAAQRLLETGLFEGIIDGGGSALTELLQMRGEKYKTVLTSDDCDFVAARTAGASGIISETAAPIPELVVAVDRAFRVGALDVVEVLDRRLHEFAAFAGALPPLVAIREACALRGLKTGPPAVPPGAGVAVQCEEFRAWFRDWLPSVLKECTLAPA